jgi:hypothetical protein
MLLTIRASNLLLSDWRIASTGRGYTGTGIALPINGDHPYLLR